MKTPHIELDDLSLIAKTVLMPGDPLRAKWIAETFLSNVVCINTVRNMLGYTGYYNKKKVTVMGSGMGMPSIGIYSYELYTNYGVENIIRIGSAGSYVESLDLYDVVLVDSAYSESTYAKVMGVTNFKKIGATKSLNNKILKKSELLDKKVTVGTIHSSDNFYYAKENDFNALVEKHNCLCVEMESFALFANAKALGKKAACLLTISDSLVKGSATTSEERQTAFKDMVLLALNAI